MSPSAWRAGSYLATIFEKIYSACKRLVVGKVLMPLRSNRVGLARSLFRGTQHGLAADDAIAEGKAAGLKAPALEKIAREKLAQ